MPAGQWSEQVRETQRLTRAHACTRTRAHTEGERGLSATGGMFPISGYVASLRNLINAILLSNQNTSQEHFGKSVGGLLSV